MFKTCTATNNVSTKYPGNEDKPTALSIELKMRTAKPMLMQVMPIVTQKENDLNEGRILEAARS